MTDALRLLQGYQEVVAKLKSRFLQDESLTLLELEPQLDLAMAEINVFGKFSVKEIELIKHNLQRDMVALIHQRDENVVNKSAFLSYIQDAMWSWLQQMSQRSDVEMLQMQHDIATNGVYQAGELVGHGILTCTQCQKQVQVSHVQTIDACLHCDNLAFTRSY